MLSNEPLNDLNESQLLILLESRLRFAFLSENQDHINQAFAALAGCKPDEHDIEINAETLIILAKNLRTLVNKNSRNEDELNKETDKKPLLLHRFSHFKMIQSEIKDKESEDSNENKFTSTQVIIKC